MLVTDCIAFVQPHVSVTALKHTDRHTKPPKQEELHSNAVSPALKRQWNVSRRLYYFTLA